jgi:tetratricopeptide (TPR) repeat protein
MPEPLFLIGILASVAEKLASGKEKKVFFPEVTGDAAMDITKIILNKGYEKVKKSWEKGKLPKDDPFSGPLRESKLFATNFLIGAVSEKIGFLEDLAQPIYPEGTSAALERAYQAWRKSQADAKDYLPYLPAGKAAFDMLQKIIQSKEAHSSRKEIIIFIKQQFYEELIYGLKLHGFTQPMPKELSEFLNDGWEKDGKQFDWFEILTLRFEEILQDPKQEKLSKAFFTELLADIKSDTGLLLVKLQELTHEMRGQSAQIEELYKNIEGRMTVKVLKSSDEIMTLLERRTRLKLTVESKGKEFEEKSELAKANLTEENVEAKLIAKNEWMHAVDELSHADAQVAELREFITTTHEFFSQSDMKQADKRLRRAKVFFDTGQFDQVRALLSSTEREQERESILQQDRTMVKKKKNFAAEELLLAKTLLIDFANPDRYEVAERQFRRSIDMYEGLFNCFSYGLFLYEQNRSPEAISYFEKALHYSGDYRYEMAAVLNNLGLLYKDIRDYEGAKKCFLQALSIYNYPNDRKNGKKMAATLDNLGILYRERNQFDLALTYELEALQIRREFVSTFDDGSQSGLVTSLDNVGGLYREMGQFGTALDYLQEARTIVVPLADSRPQEFELPLAHLLLGIGSVQFELRLYDSAEVSLLEALSLQRKFSILNPEGRKPDIGKVMSDIGILYDTKREFEKAGEYLVEALAIFKDLCEKKPGSFEPDLARAYTRLGVLYRNTGRLDDAVGSFKKGLSIVRELAKGNQDVFEPELALELNNLGAIQKDRKEFEEAESNFLEALAIQKQFAEKHPEAFEPLLGMILSNLGILYGAMNLLEKAEQKYQEALALRRKLSSINPALYDPDVADTLQRLASLCHRLKKYDLAKSFFQEALTIYSKYYPSNQKFFGGRILALADHASEMAFIPEVWDTSLGLYYLRIMAYLLLPFRADAATDRIMIKLDNLLKIFGSSLEQEFGEVERHPPL